MLQNGNCDQGSRYVVERSVPIMIIAKQDWIRRQTRWRPTNVKQFASDYLGRYDYVCLHGQYPDDSLQQYTVLQLIRQAPPFVTNL